MNEIPDRLFMICRVLIGISILLALAVFYPSGITINGIHYSREVIFENGLHWTIWSIAFYTCMTAIAVLRRVNGARLLALSLFPVLAVLSTCIPSENLYNITIGTIIKGIVFTVPPVLLSHFYLYNNPACKKYFEKTARSHELDRPISFYLTDFRSFCINCHPIWVCFG